MASIKIQTLTCGEIIVPLRHVTLHKVGDKCRVLVRDDPEWREIDANEYEFLSFALENIA